VYSNCNEIPHPSFNSDGIITNFDIMLVFLEGNMNINNTWVKLNSDISIPVVNQSVTVMGWGKTDINDVFNAGSDVLMNVEVNIVPNDECQQSEAYGQSYSNLVTENVLCARDVGQDSCQGDSGGPLIVRGNDVSTDVQIGIVSYGIGCAMEQFPGIYVRLSKAYNWIETEICKGSVYASEAGFSCSDITTYNEEEEEDDVTPSYAPLTESPSVFIKGSYSPTPPFTWYTPVIDGTNPPTTTQIIDPLFTLPIQEQETKPPSNSPSMLPSMISETTLTPTITLPIESTTEPTVQTTVSNEPTVEPTTTLTPTLNATADQQQSKFKCKWISRVGGISNPNNELCTKDDEGFPTPYLCDGIDGFVTVCCTFSSKVNTFMAGKFGTCYKVESR
jgi:hypothetical protein